jgi:hypothetical protein
MPIVERSEFCGRSTTITETSQAYSSIPPQSDFTWPQLSHKPDL